MKRHTLLAAALILVLSGSFLAEQIPLGAWRGRGNGEGQGLALAGENSGDVFAAGGIDSRIGIDDSLLPYALTAAAAAAEPARGTILFEYYWGATGSVDSLLSMPTFPDRPEERQWRTSLEGPTDWRDNYGTNVRGYLYPPGTGAYTFWIASDDQSELWLSTDEDPSRAVQIAGVPGWTPPGDFDNTGGGAGGPEQKSKPISLTGGKRYYIQVLHAEGIIGDNLAVAWQGPVIGSRTIIAGQYLSPWIGPQGVTDLNLLGWWKLNEGSGTTIRDLSGHNKHGTVYNSAGGLGPGGSVWVSDPKRGMVLSFNGDDASGAYVDAGRIIPALRLADDFTWVFWAKQDVDQFADPLAGYNDVILGNRYGGTETPLQFIKFTPTKFEYYNDDPSYTMATDYEDLPTGLWLHHAAVKKGATVTYYRNGVKAGASTLTKTMDENPLFMGGDAGGERWRGWLSDVRIYDRALSAVEIEALFGGLSLLLDPVSGPVGSTFLITGSGFAAGTGGNVNFAGTSTPVTTTPTGTFSTTMAVPSVPAGAYPVDADIPAGGAVEASTPFQVVMASSGNPTSQPGSATFCPAVVTQCPAVSTQCPGGATYCPASATKCPPVNTQCPPTSPTSCPYALTQCPPRSTHCPPVSTQCPTASTQCPASATTCPPVNTQCPPTMTQCSPTKCMSTPTVCPTVSTQCPAVSTQCPAVHTQCPGAFTQCPPVSTSCPKTATACFIQPTVCPATSSRCPVVSTQCPPATTQCPLATTTCPPVVTQCPINATYCPLVSTVCPYLSTHCPPRGTQCPAMHTWCPDYCVGSPRFGRPAEGKTPYASSGSCPAIDAPCPLVLPGPDLLTKSRADARIWRN